MTKKDNLPKVTIGEFSKKESKVKTDVKQKIEKVKHNRRKTNKELISENKDLKRENRTLKQALGVTSGVAILGTGFIVKAVVNMIIKED